MGSRILNCLRSTYIIEELFQKSRNRCFRNVSSTSTLLNSTKPSTSYSSQSTTSSSAEASGERAFLVRLKTDPDTFGTPLEKEIISKDDMDEEKYISELPLPSQRLRTKQYADIIKKLISQRKIKEAFDLVEVRMLKEDRVKPENYIYNLLLGACGRIGYTKKGFKLYNDMKRRGLPITGGTYTALFNACANSPWPESDGLTRAKKLYQIMIEKGYEPNETNYNAMIKAFGRCGDLPMAFSLVDEMANKGVALNADTINFLLQVCITDKNAGFRHALLVWRKLLEKNIKPNIFSFNLMLRSVRDCGLGDIQVTQEVINKLIPSETILLGNAEETVLSIDQGNQTKIVTSKDAQLIVRKDEQPNLPDLRPDLLAVVPHLGNIISLSELKTPSDRLILLGGCRNFFKHMEDHGCQPDIKTFTQMLDVIPATEAAENDLLSLMKKYKVRPDVDFFNMLIKKRSMRCDYTLAKEVLDKMAKYNLRPNLITYGVLSLGCKTKTECLEFVEMMKLSKYSLNVEILGAMLHQACYHFNFTYVLEVMELCIREKVNPSKKFMERLSSFKNVCREQSFKKEFSERQESRFQKFKERYRTWLNEVEVDQSEDIHPWQQYRQETKGDPKYFKWKDSSSKFKARHTSYFRNKLPPKLWHERKKLKTISNK